MYDWQKRTTLLLGKKGLDNLHNRSILIIGMGGVGGYAAEMLCRAGIGKMTIIDGDTVNASNMNRQLIATNETLGKTKVLSMAQRLRSINTEIQIIALNEYLTEQRMEEVLLSDNFDYVVDAIDTITPKLHLLLHAVENKIPIISSMGAGAKKDPSKVHVADLSKTYNCKLAKTIRKRLKKMGVKKGIKTVFSSELPDLSAVLQVEGERNKKSVLGTISYLPAIFGCFLAAEVINDLLNE